MKNSPVSAYQIPSVVPDLPHPSAYYSLLEEMHERHWYSNFGPLSRRLEAALLAEFGLEGEICVAACNATAGLSAALLACRRPGPVLLPAFTFPASLSAVLGASLRPIVADVTQEDWTLDPSLLGEHLAETGATIVMLVAPFGIRQAFTEQLAICQRLGVSVVIDNAAGLGVPRKAREQDNVYEVYSMHATKPLGVGEGGAIFGPATQEDALRSALSFGLTSYDRRDGPHWGFNGKMSELHAAVGLAQLDRYRKMVAGRQAFVHEYACLLKGLPILPPFETGESAPWQFFPVLLPDEATADRFVANSAARSIEIRRYYRPSLSAWPHIMTAGNCPVSEDLSMRMCALPVRSNMGDLEKTKIILPIVDMLKQSIE